MSTPHLISRAMFDGLSHSCRSCRTSRSSRGLATPLLLTLGLLIAAGSLSEVKAANATNTNNTINWDTTTNGWANVSGDWGSVNGSNNIAFFTNTTGSILVSANIWVNGITYSPSGTFKITNSAAGTGTITLGTNASSPNSPARITVSNAASTLTIGNALAGTSGFVKAGAGTLNLTGLSSTAANNYSGTTFIDQGTLVIGSNASLAGGLTFGATNASANVGTLDLSSASLALGRTLSLNNNASATNRILIGANQSLTLTNSTASSTLFALNNTNSGTTITQNLTVSGAGSWIATNANGTFRYGNTNTGRSALGTLDMSGLNIFSAILTNAANAGGTFAVGDNTASGGSMTMILASNSTIAAQTLSIDLTGGATGTPALKLGAGTNNIYAKDISIGNGQRASGNLSFNTNTPNGTIKLRAADGTSRNATLTMVSGAGSTGGGNSGVFDVSGHAADLLLGAVKVFDSTGGIQGGTSSFSFDWGTNDATSFLVGSKSSGTFGGSLLSYTNTLNLGVGTNGVTSNNVNTNNIGTVTLASYTTGSAGTGTNNAIFNIAGSNTAVTITNLNVATYTGAVGATNRGTVNISGGTNRFVNGITMLNVTTASAVSSANVNITGGTTTLGGGITNKANTTGAATLTLDGGTLDMGGNVIGGSAASNQITANFNSGTLRNLGDYNGGATVAMAGGSKTLTLAGTNSYTGTTAITNGGTLILSGLLGGSLGTYTAGITNSGFFNVTTTGSQILSGDVSGSGSVTMGGAGSLTLSGNNSFSGFRQNSGTVTASSATALGSGAVTLGGSEGSVSTLNIGANLTMGTLLLNGYSTLNFLTGGSSSMVSSNTVSFFGTNTVVLTTLGGWSSGTNSLISGNALDLGTSLLNFTNSTLGAMVLGTSYTSGANSYTFNTNSTSLYLVVSSAGVASLNWAGSVDSAWNTNTANWTIASSGSPSTFSTYDNVGFSTNAASVVVDGGGVTAGVMTFSNSASDSVGLSGVDIIASGFINSAEGNVSIANNLTLTNALLIQSGTGTLTLTGSNSMDGSTLNGGTVAVGNDSALGANQVTVASNSVIQAASNVSLGNAVAIASGATLTEDTAGNALTNTGSISGNGSLAKSGAGTLTLTAVNTYAGGTTLNEGTLAVGNNAALGSGTLTVTSNSVLQSASNVALNNSVSVATNVTLTEDAAGRLMTNTGVIGGNGSLAITNSTGSGTVTLAADNTYAGSTMVNGGSLALGNASALPTTTIVTVQNGGLLNLNGNGATVAGLSGGGSSTGVVTNTGAASTLRVNGAGSNNFTGTLAGALGFTMSGTGTQTLSGLNTYTGVTTITNGGTLRYGSAFTTTNTVSVNGILDLGAQGISFANITAGTGTVTSSGGAATLTLSQTPANSLNVALNDGVGSPLSLVLSRTNTSNVDFSLNNTNSTFSGGLVLAPSNGGYMRLVVTNTSTLDYTTNGSGQLLASRFGTGTITIGQTSTDHAQLFLFRATNQIILNSIVFNTALGTDVTAGIRVMGTNNLLGGTLVANSDIVLTANGAVGSLILSGQIIGAGGVTINGASSANSNTVTLANTNSNNNYAGTTTVGAYANLILGADNQIANGAGKGSVVVSNSSSALLLNGFNETINGLSGSGLVDNAVDTAGRGANTLTIGDADTTSTYSGRITNTAGSLALTKIGLGTLTLSGSSNSYSGVTTVNAGTLILSGSNALTGSIQIGSSATLLASSALGINNSFAGAISNNGSLIYSNAVSQTLSGDITGTGSLLKANTGALVLSGNNSYTGGTTLANGTLTLGSSSALGASTNTLAVNGGAVDLAGFNSSIGGLTGSAVVTNSTGSSTLSLGNGDATASYSGRIVGSGLSLLKNGAGTQTLLGNNTYAGGTILNAGTLAITGGNSIGTGALTVASNSMLQVAANLNFTNNVAINNGATLTNDSQAFSQTNSGVISGSGSLAKIGIGTTTLSGNNSYQGGSTINAGTLVASSASALGTGGVTINTGATLQLNTNLSVGSVILSGGSTLNLAFGSSLSSSDTATINNSGNILGLTGSGWTGFTSSTNYTLLSSTGLSGSGINSSTLQLTNSTLGTLNLGDSGYFGRSSYLFTNNSTSLYLQVTAVTANLVWNGSSTDWNTDVNNQAWNNTATGNADAFYTRDNVTFGDAASGYIAVDNNGVVAGTMTFSNTTGVILYGGSITSTGITNSGTGDVEIDSQLLGTGGLVQNGTGNLTLIGANAYTGGNTISNGTVTLGGNSALGASTNALNVAGGTLANDYSVTVGAVTLGNGSITGSGSLNGSSYTATNTDSALIANSLAGSAGFTQSGTGTTTLTGNNTYTGASTVNAGTLLLGSVGALGNNTNSLVVNSSGTVDLSGNSVGVGSFSGSGVVTNSTGTSSLTLGNGNATASYSGTIAGTGLSLVKTGTGTQTLLGSNSYTGTTTIASGGLQVGNNGTSGSLGSGDVTNNASLILNRSDVITVANNISGTGKLTQAGSGTTTLSGSNSYTGVTTVNGGSLVLGNTNALGTGTATVNSGGTLDLGALTLNADILPVSLSGGTLANGTLTSANGFTLLTNGTVSAALTGTGGLTKAGSGTLTLSGLSSTAANNYSGTTYLDGGTFVLGSSASLAGGLTFGSSVGSTNVGTLDLSSASLTLGSGSALQLQNNSIATNRILIGSGQALNLNGGFSFLNGSGTQLNNNLTISGAGAWNVTNSGGTFQVGSSSAAGRGTVATLDMSGLANLSLNLLTGGSGNSGGTLKIVDSGGYGVNETMITASNSIIKAGTLSFDNSTYAYNKLLLGNGNQELNISTIQIAATGNKNSGSIGFNTNTPNGTIKLRSGDGVSGVSLNMLNSINGASSQNVNATFDVSGHAADLLFSTVSLGTAGSSGGVYANVSNTAIFSFDWGTNIATNFNVGGKNTGSLGPVYSTVNLGSTNNYTNTSTIGTLSMASMSGTGGSGTLRTIVNIAGSNTTVRVTNATLATYSGTVGATNTSTLNISGGSNTFVNGITMLNNTTGSNLVSATLNITGGTTTLGGGITNKANGGGALGTATLNLNGGTLDMGNNVIGGSGASNQITANFQTGTLKNLKEFNGGAGLIKNTAGTLTLAGSNSYTGGTTVSAGTLALGSSYALGNSTNKLSLSGSVVDLSGNNASIGGLSGSSGSVTNSLGAATLSLGNGNATDSYSGTIDGSGLALVKTGTGTQTLSGNNSYAGGTVVNGGTLLQGSANALGSTNGTLTLASGTLNLGSYNDTFSAVNFGNANIVSAAGGGTLTSASFTATNSSNISLASSLAGSGAFAQNSVGSVTLSGNNSFSGGTTVSAGSLVLGSATALGNISNALTVNGGTVDLSGNNASIGGLSGTSGSVINSSGTASTLSLGNGNATATYSGTIDGSGLALVKTGTGTQTLSAANTFTGQTTINQGTLALGNAQALSASTNINLGQSGYHGTLDATALGGSGLTLGANQTLSGNGNVTLAGSSTLTINGNLAPGNSPGIVNVNGSLALGQNATTTMQIAASGNNLTAGTDFDQVNVVGNFTAGGVLALQLTSSLTFNDSTSQFIEKLFGVTGGNRNGNFSSVVLFGTINGIDLGTDGQALNYYSANNTWQYWDTTHLVGGVPSYYAGINMDTGIVTVIPEPDSVILFGVGALLAVTVARSRRQDD